MSYVQNHLLPNEYVEHTGKTTFLYLLPSLMGLFFALALFFFKDSIVEQYSLPEMAVMIPILIILAIFIILFIIRLIVFVTSEIVITNKRIVSKKGFISIRVSDIAINKCVGVSFRQSFWGRIFRYGTVETSSTGKKMQRFVALDNPAAFRNLLFYVIDMHNYEE